MKLKVGPNKKAKIIEGITNGTVRWQIAQEVGLSLNELNKYVQKLKISRGPLSKHKFSQIEADFRRRKAQRSELAEG